MYVQDYDERFMAVRQGPGCWPNLLQPYLKGTDVLVCPDVDPSVRTCGPVTQHGNPSVGSPWGGVFEGGYMMVGWERCCWPGAKLSNFEFPASTYLVVEGNCLGAYWGAFVKDGAPYHHHVYRHMDGLNILFCDGHVKWTKKTDEKYQALDNQTVNYSRTGY